MRISDWSSDVCSSDLIDVLAGALLDAATRDDLTIREEWRTRGAAFFRKGRRGAARSPQSRARSAPPRDGSAQPATGETSAACPAEMASEATRKPASTDRKRVL